MTRTMSWRLPLLAVIFLSTLALPLPAQRPGARRQQPPRAPKLQKPKDPTRVRATYKCGGKTFEVTEGQWYDTWRVLLSQEPQRGGDMAQSVIEHVLILAEARQFGCELTQAEIDGLNPIKNAANPILAKGLRDRLAAQKISEQEYVRYLAERRAIERVRNLFANSSRVLSTDIYDTWKQQHQFFRVGYIEFSAASEMPALQKSPPDEATLRRFYSGNTMVQNQLRRPTTITADLMIFDATAQKSAATSRGSEPISYEDALAYFQRNRERLIAAVPTSEKPQTEPSKGKPLETVKTPFQIMRPQIEREMRLRPMVDRAWADAASNSRTWDPKACASEYGMRYERLNQIGRDEIYARYRNLGPQLFNLLWNTPSGKVCSEVQSVGTTYYFWRLRSKSISTLPTFEEALGMGLRDKYVEFEAFSIASRKAQEAMKSINSRVDASVGTQLAAIDKKWDKRLTEALKGVSDANQKNMVSMQNKARRTAEKNKERDKVRPAAFAEWLASSGMQLQHFGPFEFKPSIHARAKIKDEQELKESFLRSYWGVRTLQPGQVVGRIASDQLSKTHFILKLESREAPDFETLDPADYLRIRSNLERSRVYNANMRWSYNQIVTRHEWLEK